MCPAVPSISSYSHRTLLCVYFAALYYQAVLIVQTIGVCQSCFVICMEKVLLTQSYDLIIDPVKQCGVALGNSGSNGVCTAQGRNTYGISFVLQSECDNFGVIICPCNRSAVLESFFCGCIGIKLL